MKCKNAPVTLGELREMMAKLWAPDDVPVLWDGDYDECGVGGISFDADLKQVFVHSTGRVGR